MKHHRFFALATLVALGVAARFLPHPPNFSPVAALGLFAGAHFGDRRVAVAVPLLILSLSNLVLGFSALTPIVYASFALIVWLGCALRGRPTAAQVASAALGSAVFFFVTTNFGVWAVGGLYPRTGAGLAACYVAALPFFRNTLTSDLLYTAALFGTWRWLERRWPALATGAGR